MYNLVLIDDEEIIRNGLPNIVNWNELGFEVIAVLKDGREGLDFVAENHVDVILADIQMPEMTGLELAEILYNKFSEIKIVLLTGYSYFNYAQKAVNLNISNYILKPSKPPEIKNIFSDLKILLDKESGMSEKVANAQKYYHEIELEKSVYGVSDFSLFNNNKKIFLLIKIFPITANVSSLISSVYMSLYNKLGGFLNDLQTADRYHLLLIGNRFDLLTILLVKSDIKASDHPVDQIQNFISKEFSTINMYSYCLALGDEFTSNTNLKSKFLEVKEYLNHGKYLPKTTIIKRESVSVEKKTIREIDLREIVSTYCDFLVDKNRVGCYEKTAELFNYLIEYKCTDSKYIINLINLFFFFLKQELANKHIKSDLIFNSNTNYIESIKMLFRFADKALYLNRFTDEIIDSLSNECNSSELSRSICRYLEVNYFNPDISLDYVATEFKISIWYLSHHFKQELNINFKDYLLSIRIDKAKDLLSHTTLKIYEIADKVGFRHQRYFSKVFRSQTNFTPLEYRNKKI